MAETISIAAAADLSHPLCSVRRGPACARASVRVAPASRAAPPLWLGLPLPDQPLTSAVKGCRAALWLGPDEWLVLDWQARDETEALSTADTSGQLASIVDISDRQVAIILEGSAAGDLLNAGCPLDLTPGAFAVGAVARTVFCRAEIIVWRQASDRLHIEVARSLADYVWRVLELAHADLVIDAAGSAARSDLPPPTVKHKDNARHA